MSYKETEDDTVYLTVKKVLDAQKTYTIKVDGVYDSYKSTVSDFALNIIREHRCLSAKKKKKQIKSLMFLYCL